MIFRILAGKPGQTSSAGGPRLQLRKAQPTVCIEDCKTNRFCQNWVHLVCHFFLLVTGKIFEITTGAKTVYENTCSYVCKIHSKLSTEYLNSLEPISMGHIAKFQVVQI